MPLPPNKTTAARTGSASLKLLVIVMVWLGLLGLLAANRQNIMDWWRLRNYQPPAPVSQLASQDTMTPYARKVFYVNQPAIDDKQQFAKVCPNNGGEQTIVLGCYHGGQAGIFLFGVSDPRLNGVEQVTAAHEMLHAAYDRLSSAGRQRVDAMLLDYYNHGLHDQRIISTIAAYKKTEPHDLVNEMHSVFGTEVTNLPQPLEQYYKRYFDNRQQVAAYAAQYQDAFTSRQATLTAQKTELDDLKAQIDAYEADLNVRESTIHSQYDALIAEKNGGNIDAYNASVPTYNRSVDEFSTEQQTTQNLINRFNQLVVSYNALAVEQNQLVKDLSGEVTPINH